MRINPFKKLILISGACIFIAACGKNADNIYRLYYTNIAGTKLTVKDFETDTKDTVKLAEELLSRLDVVESSDQYVVIKPNDVHVDNISFQEGDLILTFSDNYKSMDSTTEAMYRTAVVKTLSQISDVESVTFRDSKGVITLDSGLRLSSLRNDDYIDDENDIFYDTQWMTVGLYYTNAKGDALIRTEANIAYNSDESIEKMIVSRLADGPDEAGLYPVIPENTELLGVTLVNGVCYVNFDQLFLSGNVNASGNLPVYSVVNSLCELDEVNEVRILIDGSSDIVYRESLSLDKNFQFESSYVSN